MGTIVEKSTLRAMILEILLKDKELLKDILQTISKDNPDLLEQAFAITEVAEPQPTYKLAEKHTPISENEDIDEDELKFWINKHFEEYAAVFKALA